MHKITYTHFSHINFILYGAGHFMGAAMLRSHDQQYYCAHFNSLTLLLLDTFAKEEITHS